MKRIYALCAVMLLAAPAYGHYAGGITQDITNPNAAVSAVTIYKSFSHPGSVTAAEHPLAGAYLFSVQDVNATEAAPTATLGTANNTYAMHAIAVAGGAGSVDAGTCSLVVSGVSIDDSGNYNGSDSETIVADVTAASTDEMFETTKKWLSQVTYTLTLAGGASTCSFDYNIALGKYDDFGNRDFTLTDFECVGEGGATETNFQIELFKHSTTGWVYSAAAFNPYQNAMRITDLVSEHGLMDRLSSGQPFAFKRTGLATNIDGADSQGFVITFTTTAANAVEFINCHVGGTLR